jgi:hypothetical protein
VPQFKSGLSFLHFGESVRCRYRYARTPAVDEFLAALIETSQARVRILPAGSTYWRAQLGTDTAERKLEDPDQTIYYDEDVPLPANRMVPLPNAAHEGRVNPKGIPCLYLATDKETAMSEVRPWLGAKISLATFRTERDLRIVDCSVGHSATFSPDVLFGNASPEEITEAVWAQVDRAFSEPMNDDPATAGYVPTQVIAEAFRQRGLDGVVYQSRLGPGRNLALFALNCAKLVRRMLFKTTAIEFKFEEEPPT